MFGKLPDDPWFEELDPIIESWMYSSWAQDIHEKMDYAKEHGLLIGSFIDYDAAKKIMDADEKPDYMMTDEEFEQTAAQLLDKQKTPKEEEMPKQLHRRKRKLVK